MAAIKLYFDKRSPKKDGSYPLKLKLFHKDKARYISLDYSFTEKQWDEKGSKVISTYKNSGRVNANIRKKLSSASDVLVENEYRIATLDIDSLKNIISSKLFGENNDAVKNSREYLFVYAQELIDSLIKAKRVGSASSYKCTLKSFEQYLNNKDIPIAQINHKFLKDYEADCLNRGLKINSIGVYLRTLRAIINRAIDEEIIPQSLSYIYPFRKHSIKTEKTAKRAISKEDITKILTLKAKKGTRLWHSINYFSFMFNMRGMNFIDVAYLRNKNIHKDRLEYRRIKTGKLYSIKLTERADKILKCYMEKTTGNPNDFIFPILKANVFHDAQKEREFYQSRRKDFNEDLKTAAEMCGIETNLTSYVSRHSWASIAKFSGVAPAVIGESLGHSDLKTTEAYLANFEHNVLDDANEMIVG